MIALALLIVGCEQAKQKESQAEAVAKKVAVDAKEAAASAKEAVEAAKAAISKKMEEGLPKIEEKINGLSGETKIKAQEKFEEVKKSLAEFKSTAPDKWEALKAKVTEQYEELKKMVGMDK
jgi:hypothetical protein